jgi:hypothetical protein
MRFSGFYGIYVLDRTGVWGAARAMNMRSVHRLGGCLWHRRFWSRCTVGFPNSTSELSSRGIGSSAWSRKKYSFEEMTMLSSATLAVSEPSAPSLWLVAGTFLGLPTALWAYKVRSLLS